MKAFLCALVILAVACPAYAGILLQEDFNGTTGASVAGTNGWTGDSSIVYSSNLLDSGTSANGGLDTPTWPTIVKSFSPSGTQYTLSAVLNAEDTTGQDAAVRLQNSSNTSQILQAEVGYGELHFGIPNVEHFFQITPQPTNFVGVKMVLEGNSMDCYYRTTDTAGVWGDWTHAGLKTGLGWSMSVYDQVRIDSHASGVGGGVDSILLTSTPEPSSIIVCVTGVLGLLAYAWRKRK